jgi:hypothetical protein
MKLGLKIRPSVLVFYLVPIIIVAFLATVASASIGSLSGWGFPLQWKIGGCTTINGTITCADEFDNWLFFAADTTFFALAGYAVIFVGYRLAPRIIERVAILGPRSVLFAALFGSAITLATGFLSSGQLVNPGGVSGQNYGFPLIWKTSLASCPPPCLQANGTYYDWIFLVGDMLFYTTAVYVGLPYLLRRLQTAQRLKIHLRSRRVLGVLALTVIALSAGNYAYDSVYGAGNNWTGCGRLTIDHFSFQQSNLLTVWFRDIGPGTAALSNIYIKNANGSGPIASYPLSLTIDQDALGAVSENTTTQGLQLIQNGTYNLQIIEGQSSGCYEYTFTVTLT